MRVARRALVERELIHYISWIWLSLRRTEKLPPLPLRRGRSTIIRLPRILRKLPIRFFPLKRIRTGEPRSGTPNGRIICDCRGEGAGASGKGIRGMSSLGSSAPPRMNGLDIGRRSSVTAKSATTAPIRARAKRKSSTSPPVV